MIVLEPSATIGFIVTIILFSLFRCSKDENNNENLNSPSDNNSTINQKSFIGTNKPEIKVENYGKISLELDEKTAPITVKNFIELAEEGFYDGYTFYRIISGFMIQGVDPLGTGRGGSENKNKKGNFMIME